MKKILIAFILFFFLSQLSVNAVINRIEDSPVMLRDEGIDGGGGSVINEFFKVFFGDRITNSPSSTTNESTNIGLNPTTGNFPITDPLPLLNNEGLTYSAPLTNAVQGCLNLRTTYQQAAGLTGVPWSVLAGIHYREGGCGQNKSLVSGRVIGTAEPDVGSNCSSQKAGQGKAIPVSGGCGFASLLDSAVYAGNHLKMKIGGKVPKTQQELAAALGGYNGWGNTNCGKTPYKYCPPSFKGDDHVYVFNKTPDGKHDVMYLVYCADRTKCNPPKIYTGIGALTAAGIIDSLSKQ